jgi:hypothetical protein
MHAIVLLLPLLFALRDTFRGRTVLQLELLALRHQLATMNRASRRSSLRPTDRLLWVLLSRLLPNWRESSWEIFLEVPDEAAQPLGRLILDHRVL